MLTSASATSRTRTRTRTRHRALQHAAVAEPAEEAQEEYYADAQPHVDAAQPNTSSNVESEYAEVDHDLKSYLHSIEPLLAGPSDPRNDALESSVPADLDVSLLISSIYDQVKNNELSIATDPECSRIMEGILRASNDFQIRCFASTIAYRFHELFMHRFASHVCQTLLILAADIMERELKGESIVEVNDVEVDDVDAKLNSDATEDQNAIANLPTMTTIFLNLCESLMPFYGALITDPFGSHIVRVILNVLTGEAIATQSVIRSKKSKKFNQKRANVIDTRSIQPRAIADAFTGTLTSIIQVISSSFTNVRLYAMHKLANPVLQLLIAVEARRNSSFIIHSILGAQQNSSEPVLVKDDFIMSLMNDQVGSHLMETVIKHLPTSLHLPMFVTYFRANLSQQSLHPVSNFVVAAFIKTLSTKITFEMVLEELCILPPTATTTTFSAPTEARTALGGDERLVLKKQSSLMEKLVRFAKHGIIVELSRACVRFDTGHKHFLKALLSALHIESNDDKKLIFECILYMQTLPRFRSVMDAKSASVQDAPSKPGLPLSVATTGTYLLQSLMEFPAEHSRVVLDSLFALPLETLTVLCLDHSGSTVMEKFFEAKTIALKTKKKIVHVLSSQICSVAKSKCGSHVLDKIWTHLDLDTKEAIAQVLLQDYNNLVNDFYGRFIVRNCRLDRFRTAREDWREKLEGLERKKDMFKEFLNDDNIVLDNSAKIIEKRELDDTKDRIMKENLSSEMKALGFAQGLKSSAISVDQNQDQDDDGTPLAQLGNPVCKNTKEGAKDKSKLKKPKLKSKKADLVDFVGLDDDENAMDLSNIAGVADDDEIDDLFRGKKLDNRMIEDGKCVSEKPKKGDKAMAEVLGAIDATKKKKKKKRSTEDDRTDSKKKRKFTS